MKRIGMKATIKVKPKEELVKNETPKEEKESKKANKKSE